MKSIDKGFIPQLAIVPPHAKYHRPWPEDREKLP